MDSEPLFAWHIKKFRNFEAIFTSGAMKIRAYNYDNITIQGVLERWSNVWSQTPSQESALRIHFMELDIFPLGSSQSFSFACTFFGDLA